VPNTNVLRECRAVGSPAVDKICDWGCIDAGSPHRCGKLSPSGGAVSSNDLDPTSGLTDKTITTSNLGVVVFNTTTGEIQPGVRSGGDGIRNGIDFEINNNVGIWRFSRLTLTTIDAAPVRIVGTNAAAIVSIASIDVERTIIDVRGGCIGTAPGPGGNAGGAVGSSGSNNGAGSGGTTYSGNDSSGGGGGAHGAAGGDGGRPSGESDIDGGQPFGNPQISSLLGGGGGGGGGGPSGGVGGGGGGAIQLVANGPVRFTGTVVYAGINAGGCGGKPGASGDAGGGGGAGGTILIEASSVRLDLGGLAVNGGGGGGGDSINAGANGQFASTRATGGNGMNGAGNGGAGGAAGTTDGASNLPGQTAPINDNGGGGGGGVGRIRIHTADGNVTLQNGSFVSPAFNDPSTTATRATATIQ
jgi:hypothetical protein